MNRCGLRAALTAGAIGLAVVAGIVVFNWSEVRDHIEAWWFVMMRKTRSALPGGDDSTLTGNRQVFQRLADCLERPVIFDPLKHVPHRIVIQPHRNSVGLGEFALSELRKEGWRILEQKFPRQAYVVAWHPEPIFRGGLAAPAKSKRRSSSRRP